MSEDVNRIEYTISGCCVQSNESSIPIKGVEFLDQLCDCGSVKELFIRMWLQVQLWLMTASIHCRKSKRNRHNIVTFSR